MKDILSVEDLPEEVGLHGHFVLGEQKQFPHNIGSSSVISQNRQRWLMFSWLENPSCEHGGNQGFFCSFHFLLDIEPLTVPLVSPAEDGQDKEKFCFSQTSLMR